MNQKPALRPIIAADEHTLWQMLYYAAHMEEDGGKTVADAKTDPFLRRYVEKWGHPDDLGFIAEIDQSPVGAVWIRHLDGDDYPELAIAVMPDMIGQGIGTLMLHHIINASHGKYKMITLSVRMNNPAYRLYQRFGFETTGEVINRVGTKSYEMVINL